MLTYIDPNIDDAMSGDDDIDSDAGRSIAPSSSGDVAGFCFVYRSAGGAVDGNHCDLCSVVMLFGGAATNEPVSSGGGG